MTQPAKRGRKSNADKAEQLARLQAARQTIDLPVPNAPKPEPVKHYTSPEELMEALEPLKGKNLQIKIDPDTATWHFKYGVAEDSGTLHQPLSVIRRMAELLMRARLPAKLKSAQGEVVFG